MSDRTGTSTSRAWVIWVLVPLGLFLVIGANAHLFYVAVQSQPECVERPRTAGGGQDYRAARPAC